MKIAIKYPVAQPAVFLWIGFVGAISFMEAWLKFQAPGITVPLGLGIGKLVFGALNIMEWAFALTVLGEFIVKRGNPVGKSELWFFVPLIILAVQSFWLLPALDERAVKVINGTQLPESHLHIYYVGLEIIKITSLFVFGCNLYKKTP